MSEAGDNSIPSPRPQSKRRQKIVLTVFLVLVLAFFGVAWLATRHNPGTAKAGDCVRQTGTDSVKVVDCQDSNADFKVVGRVENMTEVQAGISACDAFDGQGVDSFFWSGEAGKKGYVLCLAKNG